MYPDGKTEGICKENGSVHWVNRTVPNVKQCSCVVKAQVAEKKGEKIKEISIFLPQYQKNKYKNKLYLATAHAHISAV